MAQSYGTSAIGLAVVFLLSLAVPAGVSYGVEGPRSDAPRGPKEPLWEVSTGSDHMSGSDFGHGAVVWAFGRSLYEEGWRLRAMAGFGRYAYDGMVPVKEQWLPVRFSGQTVQAEVLFGHQWRRGGLFLKAYAGPQFVGHEITPFDPGNAVQGDTLGAKALLEIWYGRGQGWLSSDMSYATAFGEYRGQVRVGYRAAALASVGLEGAILGNVGYRAGRAGAFMRLHWPRLEATVAGGVSAEYIGGSPSPYVSVTVDRRF